ncbi:hypothetical protein CL622_07345 [archaeon]|nr:hypothetical protein [archaeon]
MLKVKNLEIMTAVFVATTMMSCFGADNNIVTSPADFDKSNMSILPDVPINKSPFSDISQDTKTSKAIDTLNKH